MYCTSEITFSVDIMDRSRSYILDKFFEEHGFLSDQMDIYADLVVNETRKEYSLQYPDEVEMCIEEGKSYNIIASNSDEHFEVPMIMDDGYFIIQGVPKLVLIQESNLGPRCSSL